jgi:hypothetical protein
MSVQRTVAQQIPGLAPGIFFFMWLSAALAAPLELATELFAEGQWAPARVESLRAQAEASAPEAGRARLLAAVSALRLGQGRTEAKAELAALWQAEAADLETRCMAAYEFGLADWADGGKSNALAALKFTYLQTREPPLFWRSGCSLYFFLKADKTLRRQEAATWQSLQSCRDAWPLEVWRECRPRKKAGTSWRRSRASGSCNSIGPRSGRPSDRAATCCRAAPNISCRPAGRMACSACRSWPTVSSASPPWCPPPKSPSRCPMATSVLPIPFPTMISG